ncbi:MAG TPA: YdeI/OmpD-associated family protein [Cyclobacteriaceae bacterium]
MDKALVGKLKIKEDASLIVLNSPTGYLKRLPTHVQTKAEKKKKFDVVQLFVSNKTELAKLGLFALSSLAENGLLWICYPKKSGSIKTDLTRDHGWDVITSAGLEVVSLVAIDDTWSALRFKPTNKTKIKPEAKKASSSSRKKFEAVLENSEGKIDAAYVSIPYDVEKTYGTKGQVKVKAWFDGHPYRGILANMGTDCHVILVRKDVRAAINKKVGDIIKVEIEADKEERTIDIPADLQDALSSKKKAKDFFDTLSYTNRKEYVVWVTSAKKEETRERRVHETIIKLLDSKKNPSEK